MDSKPISPRQTIVTEARRMAAIIRQIEAVSPGCFGDSASVIRQLAAGDDVALNDLIAAIASARLTISRAISLLQNIKTADLLDDVGPGGIGRCR